jgi:oligopeptide/dipeptide ABC transporter ATP-binding protein
MAIEQKEQKEKNLEYQVDNPDTQYLLEVRNLTKYFPIKQGIFNKEVGAVRAIDQVSFRIKKGETLGLVGESGCGKSTLGKLLLRLITPDEGQILFDGIDITQLSAKEMRVMRQKMQLIFQDPYAALNPRMSVKDILTEPLKIHNLCTTAAEQKRRIDELLTYVQLPQHVLSKYPHEFSGGQRQRICMARALAVNPAFIICDESVSALDVSIQAQVINLLMDLQQKLGLTYLFITHDLKVVKYISHQVAVMYLGKIVEQAPAQDIYQHPQHPYTQALLSAIPIPDPTYKKERIILQGDVPNPITPPTGCHFHPRCWRATAVCQENYPDASYLEAIHWFRCHHPLGK